MRVSSKMLRLIPIMVVATAFLAYWCLSTIRKDKSEVRSALFALRNSLEHDDIQGAYETMSSHYQHRKSITRFPFDASDLKTTLDEINDLAIINIAFGKATVYVRKTQQDGSGRIIELSKEKGLWKVSSFQGMWIDD